MEHQRERLPAETGVRYRRARRSRPAPSLLYFDSSLERHFGPAVATALVTLLKRHLTLPRTIGVSASLVSGLLLTMSAPYGVRPWMVAVSILPAVVGVITSYRRTRSIGGKQTPEALLLIGPQRVGTVLRRHLHAIPADVLAHPFYGALTVESLSLEPGLASEGRWLAEGFDGSLRDLIETLEHL